MRYLGINRLLVAGIALLDIAIIGSISNVVWGEDTGRVHLIYEGQKYSLGYYINTTDEPGYNSLPETKYEDLRSWCIDSCYSGAISPINSFKIAARLATIDERSEWGFSFNPDALGFWRENAWARHAEIAFYSIQDRLPHDSRIEKAMVLPMVQMGIAVPDKALTVRFLDNLRLSKEQRKQLSQIFVTAEKIYSGEEILRKNSPAKGYVGKFYGHRDNNVGTALKGFSLE